MKVKSSESKQRKETGLGWVIVRANFGPAAGVGGMCTRMAELDSPLCLGTVQSWAPHPAGLRAPGVSYLMCDWN